MIPIHLLVLLIYLCRICSRSLCKKRTTTKVPITQKEKKSRATTCLSIHRPSFPSISYEQLCFKQEQLLLLNWLSLPSAFLLWCPSPGRGNNASVLSDQTACYAITLLIQYPTAGISFQPPFKAMLPLPAAIRPLCESAAHGLHLSVCWRLTDQNEASKAHTTQCLSMRHTLLPTNLAMVRLG